MVLALPRADLPYVLDTDENAQQIGWVLSQRHIPKDLGHIEYFSKTLTDSERNYDTAQKKCLLIIWTVLSLRPYLEGTHFTLRKHNRAHFLS